MRSELRRTAPKAPAAQRGTSLAEILVASAIGMIGMLVIAQAYIASDRFNRSTLGEGGAQTSGTIALFTLEREARMGGYGLNNPSLLGCGALNWYYNGDYSGNLGGTLPDIVLAPFNITVTPGQPDKITVVYSATERVLPTTLTKSMPSASSELNVDGTSLFAKGDLVVMVNQAGPTSCTMAQITEVQGSAAKIQHNPGISAPFNPPSAGLFPAYVTDDLVFNLGNPKVRTYAIANNSLQLTDALLSAAGATTFDLVPGIVDLRAEFGKDNGTNNGTVTSASYIANDGVVDSYDNTTPASSAEWRQVFAVRIAVLARVGVYDKPTGGACTATTAVPTWANGTRSFIVPEGVPSCYRYRVFETLVPLRNMIWQQA